VERKNKKVDLGKEDPGKDVQERKSKIGWPGQIRKTSKAIPG
jgi:hypothetical protein